MRNSWLWILAVTGFLAGCSNGSQLPLSASGASESNAVARASQMAPGVHADRRKRKLVYLSDFYTSEVPFYKWESTKLKGTISTGLEDPQGMCSGSGHAWISNTDAADLAEYAAGGTTQIGTLSDAGYYPVDCSVDPTTGNLAVANIFTTSESTGNVVIYAHSSGSGTAYTVPNIAEPFFLAYDDKGNLFVDGHPELVGSGFGFAELPAGSGSFSAVTLNKAIAFPGPVQWDGSYVAVEDQELAGEIDRFKIVGFKGRLKGTVGVLDCGALGWWIARSTLVCAGKSASDGSVDLYYYAYPKPGSAPIKTEKIAGLQGASALMVVEY
jgi:hypothetical protein